MWLGFWGGSRSRWARVQYLAKKCPERCERMPSFFEVLKFTRLRAMVVTTFLQVVFMEEFEPFVISTCEGAVTGQQRERPLLPDSNNPFQPFRIQDPFGIRNAIVPVFREDTEGRFYGLGTGFSIDGLGSFMTAHHVVDFREYESPSRPVLFLSMHAIVFGTVGIPPDCFVPVEAFVAMTMDVDDPMAALQGKPERQVAIDLSVLTASPLGSGVRSPQTLFVGKEGKRPAIGDLVLAVGFPELDLSELDHDAQKYLLSEGMYGAYGRIVAVHSSGRGKSRPGPVFEVESDWPPGMSGGPVFNSAGQVIGIVSSSVRSETGIPGRGYAIDLGMVPGIEAFAPSLDVAGWRLCWGLFSEDERSLISVHASSEEADLAGSLVCHPSRVRKTVNKIGTDEFMWPV